MTKLFQIGSENLKNIPWNKFDNDFIFLVNGKKYKTNHFLADFLSPNICQLHNIDSSLSAYEIQTEYDNDFNQVIKYAQMEEMNLSKSETEYYQEVMKSLGNYDEYFKFLDFGGDISFDNVFSRISMKLDHNYKMDEEISFIASNFTIAIQDNYEAMFSLDDDIIAQIISNPEFKIRDEDILFNFILELYKKSNSYIHLFEHVLLMNVSPKLISQFLEIFDLNDITSSIWKQMCFLVSNKTLLETKDSYMKDNVKAFEKRYAPFQSDHILEYLQEKCGGNIHLNGEVRITCSSIYDSDEEEWGPQNIIEDRKDFRTSDCDDSWIMLDFKTKKVKIDSYTLKTYGDETDSGHLKSWILEVSHDGLFFEPIDKHENCKFLNGSYNTKVFEVKKNEPHQYVRLRQTGRNFEGGYNLNLHSIEFSGTLTF